MDEPDPVEQLERAAREDYPLDFPEDFSFYDDAMDEIDELRAEVAFHRNRTPVEL